MNNEHIFNVNLEWDSTKYPPQSTRVYKKSHQIMIEGKQILNVSAAKIFKGNPNLYNPEDLLLSSLSSCHFMSYLYCCDKDNIDIISYVDTAKAILKVENDGSGKIIKAILSPVVTINDKTNLEKAKELHEQASKLCFIANSCNFEIEYHVKIY